MLQVPLHLRIFGRLVVAQRFHEPSAVVATGHGVRRELQDLLGGGIFLWSKHYKVLRYLLLGDNLEALLDEASKVDHGLVGRALDIKVLEEYAGTEVPQGFVDDVFALLH